MNFHSNWPLSWTTQVMIAWFVGLAWFAVAGWNIAGVGTPIKRRICVATLFMFSMIVLIVIVRSGRRDVFAPYEDSDDPPSAPVHYHTRTNRIEAT